MAITKSSLLPTTLSGAQDETIGEQDEAKKVGQAMRVHLVQELTKEMQEHIKNGKAQAVLGHNPHLKFGNSTYIAIQPTKEEFRRELYTKTASGSKNMTFSGLITYDLIEKKKVQDATAGSDAAMLKLQATMANYKKEKEENKVQSVMLKAPPAAGKKPQILKSGSPGTGRPSAKPSHLGSVAMSNHLQVPGSITPQRAAPNKAEAIRFTLVHFLAVDSRKEIDLISTTHIPKEDCLNALQKIGIKDDNSSWKLADRFYKEIDPYRFKYSEEEDRQSAVNNAIKAFDRLRISKEDKLWQKLLPVGERGTGKILSRLNLNPAGPGALTPVSNRPSTKSTSPDHSTLQGLLSADESQSRPQSSHKLGAKADERTKRLFSKKPAKPTQPKAIKADVSNAESDVDMAKKGVAVRVQKRKIEATKFKSAERVEESDDEDDIPLVEKSKELAKTNDGDEVARKKRKVENEAASAKPASAPKVEATTPNVTSGKGNETPAPAQTPSIKSAPTKTSPANMNGKPVVAQKFGSLFGNTTAPPPKTRVVTTSRPVARGAGSASESDNFRSKQQSQAGVARPKPNTANTSSGVKPKPLMPSASLPPKPPRSMNPTTSASNKPSSGTPQMERNLAQTKNTPLQMQPAKTNGVTANGGKPTADALHKRHPSTSTISSTASTIFTPQNHRNSTASSQSSSSTMVSTRSDLKRKATEEPAATAKPPAKKAQTVKPGNSPTNSSPLSELGTTPAQVARPVKQSSSQVTSSANTSTISRQRGNSTPATSNHGRDDPRSASSEAERAHERNRARLASLRDQYTRVFSNYIDKRVAYLSGDPQSEDGKIEMEAAQDTCYSMRDGIKALMLDVGDYTYWAGSPPNFTTPHEQFLREHLKKAFAETAKVKEQYELLPRGAKDQSMERSISKMEEELMELRRVLYPPQSWAFA